MINPVRCTLVSVIIVIIISYIYLNPNVSFAKTVPNFSMTSDQQIIGSAGKYTSTYSPYPLHRNGWQSTLIYFCRNTSRDKVWRTESWDNLKTWTKPEIVVQGNNIDDEDDLSCAASVTIDKNGLWHMYYLTAKRSHPLKVWIHHATAPAPGINWTKLGSITPKDFEFIDSPTIFYKNGIFELYIIEQGYLKKLTSTDGHNFTNKTTLNAPHGATHGSVYKQDGLTYYFYSISTDNTPPPETINVAISYDEINFEKIQTLLEVGKTSHYKKYIWTPHALISNNVLNLFYAGVDVEGDGWWGLDTTMSLAKFNMNFIEDGDLNLDNLTNTIDYVSLAKYLFTTDKSQFNLPSHITMKNFDINQDTKINLLDSIEIFKRAQ